MLVLTRKPNQKIRIGENITVTIVRVTGNTIRIGIDAPRDVRIIRSELEPSSGSTADQELPSESAADETPSERKTTDAGTSKNRAIARPEEFSRREHDVMCHAPLACYTSSNRKRTFAVVAP